MTSCKHSTNLLGRNGCHQSFVHAHTHTHTHTETETEHRLRGGAGRGRRWKNGALCELAIGNLDVPMPKKTAIMYQCTARLWDVVAFRITCRYTTMANRYPIGSFVGTGTTVGLCPFAPERQRSASCVRCSRVECLDRMLGDFTHTLSLTERERETHTHTHKQGHTHTHSQRERERHRDTHEHTRQQPQRGREAEKRRVAGRSGACLCASARASSSRTGPGLVDSTLDVGEYGRFRT